MLRDAFSVLREAIMRRPRFQNWARTELLRSTGLKTFSLRKLAALAQASESPDLATLLMLYAHESGSLERLMSLTYDSDLRKYFVSIEQRLGKRSVERLALRGTPMMTLPKACREAFKAYERAYHAPETIEAEKRELQRAAHEAMLRTGVSPAELARELSLDPGNMHAFLVRGETGRFRLETCEEITRHLGIGD